MKLMNCVFLNDDVVDMMLSIDLETVEKVAEFYGYDVNDIIVIDNFNELPEIKEGYQLRYNGSEFYYEEIVNLESEPDVWAEMAQAIAEGVNAIE